MSNAITKPKVYVETTVVSYLTARQSKDVIVAGHQQTTVTGGKPVTIDLNSLYRLWFYRKLRGDPEAAQERLRVLSTMPCWMCLKIQ